MSPESHKMVRSDTLLKLPITNFIIVSLHPPDLLLYRAANDSSVFTIRVKVPSRAFSRLKVPTSAFTFKTLLRHYAKRALTPRSLNVKLGPRRNYHTMLTNPPVPNDFCVGDPISR